jgi:hypothetical protein
MIPREIDTRCDGVKWASRVPWGFNTKGGPERWLVIVYEIRKKRRMKNEEFIPWPCLVMEVFGMSLLPGLVVKLAMGEHTEIVTSRRED